MNLFAWCDQQKKKNTRAAHFDAREGSRDASAHGYHCDCSDDPDSPRCVCSTKLDVRPIGELNDAELGAAIRNLEGSTSRMHVNSVMRMRELLASRQQKASTTMPTHSRDATFKADAADIHEFDVRRAAAHERMRTGYLRADAAHFALRNGANAPERKSSSDDELRLDATTDVVQAAREANAVRMRERYRAGR